MDQNLIMTLLIMDICTVLFEKRYTILRWKQSRRQDITNFSFKMFKIIRSLRSSECLKTTVELRLTTQKVNARSPWTACSVFDWKYLFWVSLVQKLNLSYQKTYHLSWNFLLRLIQIFIISWWCSLFCFWLEIPFVANLVQKRKIVSLSRNLALD